MAWYGSQKFSSSNSSAALGVSFLFSAGSLSSELQFLIPAQEGGQAHKPSRSWEEMAALHHLCTQDAEDTPANKEPCLQMLWNVNFQYLLQLIFAKYNS